MVWDLVKHKGQR